MRFGTGFIFQPFAAAAAIEKNQRQTMLVVRPLQSVIIDYQIAEARRMGMSAAWIADVSDGESRSANLKLLFGVWLSRKKYGHLSAYATN